MVLYLYAGLAYSVLGLERSSEAVCEALCVFVGIYMCTCSNGVETEGMLEHGATGREVML